MKKFKKMQNVIAVVLALVLLLNPMSVFAEELPTEARYDLEKGGTQTFTIREEDGSVATVTIEEVSGNSRIANGNYKVTYDLTGIWNAGFYVSISNNQIYNAYSPFYYCFAGEIKYPALTRPSVTQARLAFIYIKTNIYYSTGVDATIKNGELLVTKRPLNSI